MIVMLLLSQQNKIIDKNINLTYVIVIFKNNSINIHRLKIKFHQHIQISIKSVYTRHNSIDMNKHNY